MERKPSYYAVIPSTVRYDKDLSASEKLLYGEITALANKQGYCFAANSYFAELYKTTERTITRWISKLENKNYIKREMLYGNNKEFLERRLYIVNNLSIDTDKNVYTPPDKNVYTPPDKNVGHNNTSMNNTSINNINNNPSENWFNEFWSEYPKKIAKQKCLDKFKKICTTDETFSAIMTGLRKYNELQYQFTDTQFIPNPLTWLNQERWLDEIHDKRPKNLTFYHEVEPPSYFREQKDLNIENITETDLDKKAVVRGFENHEQRQKMINDIKSRWE